LHTWLDRDGALVVADSVNNFVVRATRQLNASLAGAVIA
jgi:hypothetical protein